MNDDPHRSASHANVAGGSGIGSGARFSVERSQIQRHLDILQKNLDSNQQVRDEEVSKFDDNAMPDLIALANRKRPGLNAHLVIGVDGFVEKTLNLLTKGARSFRIVARTRDRIHFVAFDVDNDGSRTSIIAIEPVFITAAGANSLAPMCAIALRAKLPDVEFLIVNGQMQHSGGECGMFSLFLAKMMFKAADDLKLLREDTALPRFYESRMPVLSDVLPPRFMKHAQPRSRVKEYLSKNENRAGNVVNKRGEALEPRFMRHWGEWNTYEAGPIWFSRSIEVKRVREYQALLDAMDEENQGQP
jgi:YopJ family protease